MENTKLQSAVLPIPAVWVGLTPFVHAGQRGSFETPAPTALTSFNHAVAMDCMSFDSLRLSVRIRAIRAIRITISEDAVSRRAFLVIRFGNHLLALISTSSESVPFSDHQWLKTPLFGHSVAAAPRWVIRGEPPRDFETVSFQKFPPLSVSLAIFESLSGVRNVQFTRCRSNKSLKPF